MPARTTTTTKAPRSSKKTTKAETTSAPVEQVVEQTTATTNEVVTNDVVQETTTTSTEQSVSEMFNDFVNQLTAMRTQITTLTTQLRTLRSRTEREIKSAQKNARRRKNTNRQPSGFVKPTRISKELCTFLGKPEGTEMARTQVTREITAYIRAHKLQDPENGRNINADAKLKKLLNLNKGDKLTYFNLQKFMSPHFAKASDATAPTANA